MLMTKSKKANKISNKSKKFMKLLYKNNKILFVCIKTWKMCYFNKLLLSLVVIGQIFTGVVVN